MSYHPLYGIAFFLISLFIAYFLGKKCKKQYKLKRNKNMQELIAPDASWLD